MRLCLGLNLYITMHIFWKYITVRNLNIPYVGIFVKDTLCVIYLNQKKIVNQNKGKKT